MPAGITSSGFGPGSADWAATAWSGAGLGVETGTASTGGVVRDGVGCAEEDGGVVVLAELLVIARFNARRMNSSRRAAAFVGNGCGGVWAHRLVPANRMAIRSVFIVYSALPANFWQAPVS